MESSSQVPATLPVLYIKAYTKEFILTEYAADSPAEKWNWKDGKIVFYNGHPLITTKIWLCGG